MPIGQLAQVLRDVIDPKDDRLLVGPDSVDDAGVVWLDERDGLPEGAGIALVQTVDYFPPVLDDPHAYGAVAAANALSDVYAMGGRPISVLNIAGFPKGFDPEWVQAIFRGGFEKVREAGAVIAGGHTVESAEPLFGFAVTGVVDRAVLTSNDRAQVGDVLYLTKPLGMGSITTGGKFQKVDADSLAAAAVQMATLNDRAAQAMVLCGARACTDITGFGLVGHGRNVADASGVTLRFHLADLPIFPGARELAAEGVVSGGTKRGKAALGERVRVADGVDSALVDIAYDAETSGGLLIAVPPERAPDLERELAQRDLPVHRVGEIVSHSGVSIELA